MKNKNIDLIANKLVRAFLKNKIISPIPSLYTKKIFQADKLRKLCESKIKKPVIGFKAGGTALPVLKKLKEKEPFYGSVYSKNLLRSGKRVKINQYVLGIELEVCYLIKKNFFLSKQKISKNNITKFITHMAPCLEIVGYRQRKKGVKYLGDLCSDFGANIKFLIGKKTKFKKINIGNLNTYVKNNKNKEITNGNTSAVYINPLNSLIFVLKKIKRDKINLNKNFYIFTGSTVGIVPFTNKGTYIGKIEKLGSVKTTVY